MKRKQLLFTLLLALMVPLAANAYVERTVTVYNGIAKNSHIPIEGWNNGSNQPFSVSFSVSEFDLARAGLYDKPISKMAFHVATPGVYTITNNNRYTIKMRNPAYENEFTTVAEDVLLRIDEYGVMEINFNWHYTYRGGADLIVNISSPMSYPTSYPDYLPQFYGVNIPGVENGYGTHGNGFKPKITFTYFDEATWANTNRPQGLWLTVGSDGTSLGLSWDAVEATDATYQVCCMPRGNTPGYGYNSSDWVTSQNTLSHTFTGLTPNTEYDLYVRARNQANASAYSRAMCTTKRIANLDEGDLELDFDEGFVSNGITCTGDNNYMLDVIRTRYRPDIYVNLYNSYFLNYEGNATATVNLPQITFSGASNGVIMEFDLWSADNLQVKFIRQSLETNLGTFTAGDNKIRCTVHLTGNNLALQSNNAYFQLVSSGAFHIDNILIHKVSELLPVTNLAASNIGENEATISWTDSNINTHSLALFYRPKGFTGGDWYSAIDVTGTSYTLTGLSPYTQYEVKVQAYNTSVYENSSILTFATSCPATDTPYTQLFTNLSDLPQYWRVATGEGVSYSVSGDRLKVFNSEYLGSWGYTYYTLDAYIILPYFENLASLQLDFKAGINWGDWIELTVGVMSDPFDASTFSILEIRTLNNSSTTYNISLADAACQHGHIAIKVSDHYLYPPYEEVWFDDFTVTRYAAPTDLTVSNITKTTATLDWNGIAPEYEISYKKSTDSNWTIVTTTDNHYTLSNLSRDTQYQAKIKAKYGENLYSTEVSFADFKTYYYEPVVISSLTDGLYSQDFNASSIGDWELINGSCRNKWVRQNDTGLESGGTDKCVYISNTETAGQVMDWAYTAYVESQLTTLPIYSTTYFSKVFTLTSGNYQFSYKYAVDAVANSDYMRVLLVPANTTFEPGNNMPTGLNYVNEPEGWIAIDGGAQLTNQSASLGWRTMNVSVDVYPGGDAEPGDYKMVFVWHNDGRSRPMTIGNNPGALDDVEIQWSSLIDPPSGITAVESDTQADIAWTAPSSGFTPTGYQVQYEPLGNNGFEGAPIVDANTNAVTLTGLMAHTSYQVRVRSAYTAGGNTIYSDWTTSVAFTTLYPRPTNLTLVEQTSSWASMMWDAVVVQLEEGQYLGYSYQLTTNPDNWGATHDGVAGNVWSLTLAPGTYYFRVQTVVRDNNNAAFRSPWSEPITFTIAPWANAVTVFPLTYDFEESRFDDGITLGGNVDDIGISMYYNSGVSPHDGSENENMLRFNSGANRQAYFVLPPLHPSTGNALVSFWWYHHSGHQNFQNTNINDGVEVESSTDGQNWSTVSYGMIPRYDADYSGWKKYDFVFTASANPTYVRLHFRGTPGSWLYCYLDDLTVNTFQSQQPYISYVDCDANTATITLYDYAYENGWPSSAFQVQYREYRDPGQTQEEWSDPLTFTNQEPYAFIKTLTVTGLQPTTLYEFRACARVSYGGFDFEWSSYCEPYRQWTSCGTYTITSDHSYTIDFEDEFYYNCWTGDIDETAWHVTTDDAHSGTKSFCVNGVTWKTLSTPTIDLTQLSKTTDNVIMRFWAKTSTTGCQVLVRYTYNGNTYNPRYMFIPKTDEWKQFEISLSKRMEGEITVEFKNGSNNTDFYLDDIEIVANPYSNTKIFDLGEDGVSANWTGSGNWFPDGTPDGNTNVRILEGSVTVQTNVEANAQSVFVGPNGRLTVKGTIIVDESLSSNIAKINTATNGEISGSILIGSAGVLNAASLSVVDAYSFKVNDGGTANIGTLNPGEANSVVVKDGGVLNANAINGTDSGNDKILIESGGQVKSGNAFYGIIEKNITGYGTANANNATGWYLVASPTEVSALDFVPQSNLFNEMDMYQFNGSYELEWYNLKCSNPNGCAAPNGGTTPQGTFTGAIMVQPTDAYLYARQEDGIVRFVAGTQGPVPFRAANDDQVVTVHYYTNPADASLNGWNLIGNPYTCNAYLKQGSNYISFYKMNDAGDAIVGVPAGTAIKPCEAVFVRCTESGSTVTFTTTEPAGLGDIPDDPMILLPTHALYEDQDAGKAMEIILIEGWNWIAPTVEMSVEALQSVLGSDAVIQREEGNTNATVAPGQMVKIHVDEDGAGAFTLLGRVVASNITIENGINWIGYTGAPDLTIVEALGSIVPVTGDKIISQDEGFAIFNGTTWTGTLTTLESGKGYVYFRNTSGD